MEYRTDYLSLERAVRELAGEDVKISRTVRVHGGDINDAYHLILSDDSSLFLKTNTKKNIGFFLAEAEGLEALRSTRAVCVPQVFGIGTDDGSGCSFLLMEYIESQRPGKMYWETFGRCLAALHRSECGKFTDADKKKEACGKKSGRFGFMSDNFIGASPQKNSPRESWVDFYRDCRLTPQLNRAAHVLPADIRRKADRLLGHLDAYLRESEFPSLLHGDLWSGNMMCGVKDRPWIIDPAVYAGDCEADLAMTQLFGSLPGTFYDAYREVNPIQWREYEERRDLYHLYHLLNHLNLFGTSYLGSVVQVIRRYSQI